MNFKNGLEAPKQADCEAIIKAYEENTKEVLNNRYKELMEAKQNSFNINERYDLVIAITELKTIYHLLFGKEV